MSVRICHVFEIYKKKKLIWIPLHELDGIALEDVYVMFYREYKDVEVATSFVKFFQHTQVKSYSEAMCETVGSIMKIHGGQGRNLHPANFSKEIFLKFNLPPLHIMKQKLIPEVAKDLVLNEKKSFPDKINTWTIEVC